MEAEAVQATHLAIAHLLRTYDGLRALMKVAIARASLRQSVRLLLARRACFESGMGPDDSPCDSAAKTCWISFPCSREGWENRARFESDGRTERYAASTPFRTLTDVHDSQARAAQRQAEAHAYISEERERRKNARLEAQRRREEARRVRLATWASEERKLYVTGARARDSGKLTIAPPATDAQGARTPAGADAATLRPLARSADAAVEVGDVHPATPFMKVAVRDWRKLLRLSQKRRGTTASTAIATSNLAALLMESRDVLFHDKEVPAYAARESDNNPSRAAQVFEREALVLAMQAVDSFEHYLLDVERRRERGSPRDEDQVTLPCRCRTVTRSNLRHRTA
jgi:hypothetical protein